TKKPLSSTSTAMASSLPSKTIGGAPSFIIVLAIGARGRGENTKFICSSRGARGESITNPRGVNLPARFCYARDQPLRSQFAKGQARHLEPANKSAPASADFAAVHHARRTRVPRQLRQASVVLFRL